MDAINDSLPLAAMTVGQARQFIRGLVSQELEIHKPQEPTLPQSDIVNIEDAVDHLRKLGYPVKKNSVYNLVAKDDIPYRKIGRRLVFSRTQLTEWLESKYRNHKKADETLILAESARRKK